MFSSSTFLAHVLGAQVQVDSTAAAVDDVHRLMRTAQTTRRGKTSVKGGPHHGQGHLADMGEGVLLQQRLHMGENALETRVSSDWKLKGRYSLWAADVLVNAARSGAASSGDPPPGGSPAAASQTAHTKKRSRSAVRRQGRRVRGAHRLRRWGVGVLDEQQPQHDAQRYGWSRHWI